MVEAAVITPSTRIWSQMSTTEPLTNDATPPAKIALLAAAVSLPQDAATLPYAGCGRLCDATAVGRYLGIRVAPGAQHARAHVVVAMIPNGTQVAQASSYLTSATGGTTGADVLLVQHANKFGQSSTELGITWSAPFSTFIVTSSETVNDTPTTSIDRQLELQSLTHPYTEQIYISDASGTCIWVSERIADLESLA